MPKLIACLFVVLSLAGCVSSGGGGGGGKWVLLGERAVDFRGERDVITVTGAAGKFRKIKLKVRKRGIKLFDLKVVFGNGDVFDVAVKKAFPKGGETRVIDLPGKRRIIKRVEFVYKSRPKSRGKGKAIVRLWGRH